MRNNLPHTPRIVLAGAVESTLRTLEGLLRNGANVVGVLGLDIDVSSNISGYSRFDTLAREAKIPYADFKRINSPEVMAKIRQWEPDFLFAVGLSQILCPELLAIPRKGCVGFHPTCLPEGRGRAPIAWLTFERRRGAASFFEMNAGVDAGGILVQEPFEVFEDDYADDVISKALGAIDIALDRWLPRLLAGEWDPKPQSEVQITEYGRRMPDDGKIDWNRPTKEIYALIRAASRPHPGAYTFIDDRKLIIWRARPDTTLRCRGVVGRIVRMDNDKGALVQTADGLLWLTEVDGATLKVGKRLGYCVEEEINQLKERVNYLEERLRRLEKYADEKILYSDHVVVRKGNSL